MLRGALCAVLASGISLVLAGCFADTCWDLLECPQIGDLPAPQEPSCDPAAGEIAAACDGVYVSAVLGDDAHEGTEDRPVRTLGKALELAQIGPRRVYACAERFTESLVIPSGLELWGGLDCASGWAHIGATRKTIIAPDAGVIPLRIVADAGRSTIADVRSEAADAVLPGGSSIAVTVAAGAAVEIRHCELVAGRGADGDAGRSGGVLPADAGTNGGPGNAACSAVLVPGGAGAIHVCDGVLSLGGQGGNGGLSQGGSGTGGAPEPNPNPGSGGLGGAGESASVCEVGKEGALGTNGQPGQGGDGPGSFSAEGWQGVRGGDGTDGRPGQGGGGGGGSRGGAMLCGVDLAGASGGGGGAGGCGGKGGTGGGFGGASIGLLTLSGDVALRSSSIYTRGGGDGGAGGRGQFGGAGGAGGPRGSGSNMALPGCDGGPGGRGGDGGHAGGGLGGPSIGVLYPDGLHPDLTGNALDFQIGPAGKGGAGGDPTLPGASGDDGIWGETVGFPP